MSKEALKSIKIILLDINEGLCKSWSHELAQLEKVLPISSLRLCRLPVEIYVHNEGLDTVSKMVVPDNTTTTTIVSPGNSGGFLGGGFDKLIANYFNPSNWRQFESLFQQKLYKVTNGYCTRAHLIDLDLKKGDPWDILRCDSILHLPTMKVPRKLKHNSHEMNQLIFDLTWDIFSTLSAHNGDDRNRFIDTVIVPGLGTGYGGVPIDICAKAMCYAIFIYSIDSLSDQERLKLCLRYLGEDHRGLFPRDTGKKFDFESDGPEVLLKRHL